MTWRKKEISELVSEDIGGDETSPTIEETSAIVEGGDETAPTIEAAAVVQPTVVFMPGCFDRFEGTQEELEEIIEMIKSKVADGSIITEAHPLEDNDEMIEEIISRIEESTNRTLQ